MSLALQAHIREPRDILALPLRLDVYHPAHLASRALCIVKSFRPLDPLFRALSGRLKFTVRRHEFSKDSFSFSSLLCTTLPLLLLIALLYHPARHAADVLPV